MAWVDTYVLDDDGNPRPAETLEWGAWLQTTDKRRVRYTRVGDRIISTIFVGLDYSFDPDPMRNPLTYRPVLWESAVAAADGEKTGEILAMRRAASRDEAIQNHEEFINQLIVNWTEAHQEYPQVEEVIHVESAASSAPEPRPGA